MSGTAIWYSRTSSVADGKRSVLLSIIKNGNASTLTVVNAVKHILDFARAAAPLGMVIKSLFDQSVFVVSSVVAVLREGAIAAGLTALMILLFLGSWRPTPDFYVQIERARALQFGMTTSDIGNNVGASLSSSE
jgi:multidrug efflux pump subunit AcrB